MNAFCSDVDLLKFEPSVFGPWRLASQVVASGSSGLITGTAFAASGVDFIAAAVVPGQVIHLQSADQTLVGAYEIVAVPDATHLTVSVIRADPAQAAIPVGAVSGLTWHIVTYAPQAAEILWQISERLGLAPGTAGADHDVEDILNPGALRQAAVFGTLMLLFQGLYQGDDGQDILDIKARYYRTQYAEALARVRLRLDTDADGHPEKTLRPDITPLTRK